MEEPKKMSARTPEQLSMLERRLFGIGSVFGFVNAMFLKIHGAPSEAYFVSALPLLPIAFVLSYQLCFRDTIVVDRSN